MNVANWTTRNVRSVAVGSAVATPGEIVYGWFEVCQLPTGQPERLPVIIVQGEREGPCFWLTANIHGDELTGMAAIHDTIQARLLPGLRGTIVAIPTLNPGGLRVEKREPYLGVGDPNRTFPGFKRATNAEPEGDDPPGNLYEDAMARLFEAIKASADYLLDLHCYDLQATSFTIRDRVLYHNEDELEAAHELFRVTDELCQAFGLPVVNEKGTTEYIDSKLHRSTSGAALNEGRIPAVTIELGLTGAVDPNALQAARTGILNSLKWAGMIPGAPEAITSVPQPKLPFTTQRANTPKAPATGILRYLVKPGDVVQKGDLLAVITDVYGRPLPEDSQVRASQNGWIISLSRGAVCYKGQTVTNMAIPDDKPMVEPFPK